MMLGQMFTLQVYLYLLALYKIQETEVKHIGMLIAVLSLLPSTNMVHTTYYKC